MKRILGIFLLIIGLMTISVSIYWYTDVGQKALNVTTYNLGEVDKIKVRGNTAKITFKTGTHLNLNTKNLAIVKMTKEEMDSINKDKNYYSTFLYFSEVNKVFNATNWIPNSIKNIQYLKNKNNKLAYFLDDVTYEDMHKALPDIKAYSTMDNYQKSFESKNTQFNENYSNDKKTNLLETIYSMNNQNIFGFIIIIFIVFIYFAISTALLIQNKEEKEKRKQKKIQKEASKEWKPQTSNTSIKQKKLTKIRKEYKPVENENMSESEEIENQNNEN